MAVVANYSELARRSGSARAAAVVKADAYGLGAARIGPALRDHGVTDFFVAMTAEAHALRAAIGAGPRIFILGGGLSGEELGDAIPVLNSPEQYFRDRTARPGQPFAVQLDSGMNRLGMEPGEWAALRAEIEAEGPALIMSHLACADEPDHPMNAQQLAAFRAMTEGVTAPRSLAATGGILLGPDYHFDLTRPGIGLYGGAPFTEAQPVVSLSLPVIQSRDVATGESVGYGNSWIAPRPSRIATVAAGYADGIHRALSSDGGRARIALYAGDRACPVVGRVSMDLITVDVTDLDHLPAALDLLGPHQGVDDLADAIGTIGYELLCALRLNRQRA